jgi:hypothetical protein
LYLGDNLRADLVEAKRVHGWTTACVLKELESEVSVQGSEEFQQLHHFRSCTRKLLSEFQESVFQETRREKRTGTGTGMGTGTGTGKLSEPPPSGGEGEFSLSDREFINSMEKLLQSINAEMSHCFHPQFGSIFRSDGHPSLFAFAVRRYADLYMSDISALMGYSNGHLFYPSQAIHLVSICDSLL